MPTLVSHLKEDFGLTSAETLQILNFMPRETVEIHLIIQDLPSRLTEERQEELLKLIGSYITEPDEEQGDINGNEELVENEEVEEEGFEKLPKEMIAENGDSAMLKDVAVKIEPS